MMFLLMKVWKISIAHEIGHIILHLKDSEKMIKALVILET